jgi:hypothetical protein
MANELTEYLKGRPFQGFHPHPFYSKEGDFLTYYFRGDEAYADRVDDILTVYRSMESNELVGFKIKGVRHLMETLSDFYREYRDDDGEVMLSLLVMAGMGMSSDVEAKPHYKQIGRQTQTIPLKARELQPT